MVLRGPDIPRTGGEDAPLWGRPTNNVYSRKSGKPLGVLFSCPWADMKNTGSRGRASAELS